MVTMARELGLRVVAEGIETPAARDILQELGCDIGQGYHFEHPLPASEIPRAIAELEAITVHGTVTRLQPHAKRRGGN
jgi:EAL domain-containing protein (putative c-di-GMP-specific phosphodiesterase class I)